MKEQRRHQVCCTEDNKTTTACMEILRLYTKLISRLNLTYITYLVTTDTYKYAVTITWMDRTESLLHICNYSVIRGMLFIVIPKFISLLGSYVVGKL